MLLGVELRVCSLKSLRLDTMVVIKSPHLPAYAIFRTLPVSRDQSEHGYSSSY